MGLDGCARTLRTASGHALTSYGRCDIHLQVPPIANPAKVTLELVDVHHPILSVAGLVAHGHRLTFRGRAEHCRRSRRNADVHSGPVVLAGVGRQQRRVRACRQRCGLSRVSARLGPPHEFGEQVVYTDNRETIREARAHRQRMCVTWDHNQQGSGADAKAELPDDRGGRAPRADTPHRCGMVRSLRGGSRSRSTTSISARQHVRHCAPCHTV